MRHFRLKKTITHATVLSALFPTGVALSNQVQIPIGLASKITLSASATAIVGHQVVPSGLAPMDPKSAPARGGYVYDAFDRVVRTGVTGECVKHGFWSPELATPDCEPWLFAKPAPAAAPAPAPKAAEPAPAPAPKAAEGFPEWIGPDEFRVGVVPLWPENEFEEPNNIGLPRMYFDGEEAGDEHTQDLVSAPTLYGEQAEHEGDQGDLVSPPVVYYDGPQGGDEVGDLISAPRFYGDEDGSTVQSFNAGQWPADPFAAGIPDDRGATDQSNDNWMPAPATGGQVAAPSSGIMEFKEEGVWPTNPYPAGEFVENQPVTASDDSWVIPNPLPGTGGEEAVGTYEEGGRDPEELVSNPVMYFDTEDQGIIPPEHIIGHTLVQTEDDADQGAPKDDHIIGHNIFHGDDDAGVAQADNLVGAPKTYPAEEQTAAAPYDGSEFSKQPFPESPAEDAPEGEPFNSQFPAAAVAEAPAPVVAMTDEAPAASEDDGDLLPYLGDQSKVPVAQASAPTPAVAAAPAEEKAPAPVKEEEHLMTVVLSADALFEFDRYAVRKGGNKGLRDFVDALKDVKWGQIVVVGHTDRLGSDKYNLRLSERRAQTVRRELIKLGLDGKKIKAIGKGKTEPVTKDCVGDKRSKELIECLQPDRRVEIFVDEKQQITIRKAPAKK